MAGGPFRDRAGATQTTLHRAATVSNSAQAPPLLVPVAEAARRLGVSDRHAWTLVARGDLASVLVGGRIRRVVASALDDYVDGLRSSGVSGGSDTT